MATHNVFKLIKDNAVEFVDLRFADMLGKQHHVSFPAHAVDDSTFEDGKMFDGSSISGWKGINESDMVLMPDRVDGRDRSVRSAQDAAAAVRCARAEHDAGLRARSALGRASAPRRI